MSENQFMRPMMKSPEEKPWSAVPRTPAPRSTPPQSTPREPMSMHEQEEMHYRLAYPEIFYKLQPFIIAVCDEMDTFGDEMPNQEMIEHLSDSIYKDVCEMYPDLAEYGKTDEAAETQLPLGRSRFNRRFRRRGLFRDLIDILILSELSRRRRRRRYF